jgi:hypothetical protein
MSSHRLPYPLEHYESCVEFQYLYEGCGDIIKQLVHLKELGGHSNCHFVQSFYIILPGQCDSCAKPGLLRAESIHKVSRAVGPKPLTNALGRSIQKKAELKEEIGQLRLERFRSEIKKHENFVKAFKNELEEESAYTKKLSAARVEEEHGYVDPQDRVVVYDAKKNYCELLSKVYDKEGASCCSCHGKTKRVRGELKFLPCQHAIRDDSLCFFRWYHSSQADDLTCPACKRRINVLEQPLNPLNTRHWGRSLGRMDTAQVPSFVGREEEKTDEWTLMNTDR